MRMLHLVGLIAFALVLGAGFQDPAFAQHVRGEGFSIDRSLVFHPARAQAFEQLPATSSDELATLTQLVGPPPSETQVTVVQPDAISRVAETAPAIIAAGVMAILLRLVGPFGFMLRVARADQIIERYAKGVIDDWLDHNPNWRTQGITVDVKNAWVANIATHVINYAPSWLIAFLGGKEAILQKVKNRMPDVIKEAFPALFDAHYTSTGAGVRPSPNPPA